MSWNPLFPIGTISVKANEVIGTGNMSYIQTTMGVDPIGTNAVTTRDHFWDVGANEDGRHRFVQSPDFTVGGNPADPVIGTGMDVVYYSKLLSSTVSTAQQDVQAFFKNGEAPDQIMMLLGIRAMGVFTANTGVDPTQAEVVYSHNLALQAAGTPGIVSNGTGRFTITFDIALPSTNYLVLGSAIRDSADQDDVMIMSVAAAASLTNSKSTTTLKLRFKNPNGSYHNPLQAWFVCFGG